MVLLLNQPVIVIASLLNLIKIIFADRNEAIDLQMKLGQLMPHLEVVHVKLINRFTIKKISMARQKTTMEWRDKANMPQQVESTQQRRSLPQRRKSHI